jgi:hypothetical protein
MRGDHGAEGVAVRCGLGDDVGADDGVGARLVFEDDGLAERVGDFLADQAGHQVGVAARRVGHDHADRPVRPALRQRAACAAEHDGQRCNGAE